MRAAIDEPIQTRVYTTGDGRAVIEQSQGAVVFLSADQILKAIDELRACYDYCAAWKQPAQEEDRAVVTEIQR
jgi:hypothetical protein